MGQCISKHTADDGDSGNTSNNQNIEDPDTPSSSTPIVAPAISTSTVGHSDGDLELNMCDSQNIDHAGVPSLSSPIIAPIISTSKVDDSAGNASTTEDAKGWFKLIVFVRGPILLKKSLL